MMKKTTLKILKNFLLFPLFLIISILVFYRGTSPVSYAQQFKVCPPSNFQWTWAYYSQFYEDYILSYVFHDYDMGYYIDVGASNPNILSVTKYFYLRGWRGINIEPIPDMINALKQYRIEDINLQIGISNSAGNLKFYEIKDNYSNDGVLSTFDEVIAKSAIDRGFKVINYEVLVITLNEVLQRYILPRISFLKIDVEGYETQVLEGLDLSKYRPEVIVVEATIPNTETPSYKPWEYLITKENYSFAFFDGLNRYYFDNNKQYFKERFEYIGRCVIQDKSRRNVKVEGFKRINQ